MLIPKIWSKEEIMWGLALYGTAVGAGTLFLPIQLGYAGTTVLLIASVLAYPLTYWSHKALCQFILSSNSKGDKIGIIGAVNQHYGYKIGSLITSIYFLAFFAVVLIYATAITNSLMEQLVKYIKINVFVRLIISLLVVITLNLIFLMGRHITIKVMGFLVFPLIGYFLFLSLYLIRIWQQPILITKQISLNIHVLHQVWISIPVIVFAFSHTPIISTFAVDRQEKYGIYAMDKCKKIMRITYFIICVNVLFFVFSCILSIPPSYILNARKEGITVLSVLSMLPSSPTWLGISGVIIAITAMSKSFLGTYFGVIEGATEMMRSILIYLGIQKDKNFNRILSIILVSFITFAVCCVNPNAISMIYTVSGPLIAIILFIMPTLSTLIVSKLKPYRSAKNMLTLTVGILCVLVMFVN